MLHSSFDAALMTPCPVSAEEEQEKALFNNLVVLTLQNQQQNTKNTQSCTKYCKATCQAQFITYHNETPIIITHHEEEYLVKTLDEIISVRIWQTLHCTWQPNLFHCSPNDQLQQHRFALTHT